MCGLVHGISIVFKILFFRLKYAISQNKILRERARQIYTHVAVAKQKDILTTKHPRKDMHI